MENKQLKDIEYFLGRSEHNGYEIIEHNTSRPQGSGCCVFDVCEYWISDGDGFPAKYDGTYVKISEEVYKHAIDMFRSAGEKMDSIGDEISVPINRELMVGDYIYSGGGTFLKIIAFNQGEPVAENFYYSYYDLNFDLSLNTDKLSELDFEVSELQDEGHLITQEIYEKALSVVREAALRIKAYLEPYFKKQKC